MRRRLYLADINHCPNQIMIGFRRFCDTVCCDRHARRNHIEFRWHKHAHTPKHSEQSRLHIRTKEPLIEERRLRSGILNSCAVQNLPERAALQPPRWQMTGCVDVRIAANDLPLRKGSRRNSVLRLRRRYHGKELLRFMRIAAPGIQMHAPNIEKASGRIPKPDARNKPLLRLIRRKHLRPPRVTLQAGNRLEKGRDTPQRSGVPDHRRIRKRRQRGGSGHGINVHCVVPVEHPADLVCEIFPVERLLLLQAEYINRTSEFPLKSRISRKKRFGGARAATSDVV